jgi:hypothetical protein
MAATLDVGDESTNDSVKVTCCPGRTDGEDEVKLMDALVWEKTVEAAARNSTNLFMYNLFMYRLLNNNVAVHNFVITEV